MADARIRAAALAPAEPGRHEPAKVVPLPTGATQPKRPRDRRIDVFRGLALAMIFINHVPGTVYENFTSRNFGFSDAAEVFVFISGTSAALAYAGIMAGPRLWPGLSRIWGRAWTLYLVHLLITVWVIGIAAATLRLGGDATLFMRDNVQYLWKDLTGVLTGLPIMTHQIGYVNILPMYAVLLLATPFLILAARRWPLRTLAASVGLWVAAGLVKIAPPNFPTPGGWFLNPVSWQLLFVLGLLTGLALKDGERFVPRNKVLVGVAAAILVGSLVWLKVPPVGAAANAFLGKLATLGVPGLVRDFDKTYLSVPRLAHALAVIYLISALPVMRWLSERRWTDPLATLGRHALPVFALGTILSFAARSAQELGPDGFLLDSTVILGGLVVLWTFAAAIERGRAAARA